MVSFLRFRFLLFLIFITAFCSYAYELVLAQMLSIILGDVVLQYTLTTGIYIASMGAGAFFSPTKVSAKRSFIWVEIVLSLLAFISPFCLIASDFHFRQWGLPISYLVIALIGLLSGMELPLLLRILHDSSKEEDKTERALFIDYMGMFFAGLLFALYLNRTWGTLKTSLWLSLANLGLALMCGFVWGYHNKKIHKLEIPFSFACFGFVAWFLFQNFNLYQDQLEKWVLGN